MHRYSVRHIYLPLYVYTFIYIDTYRCKDIVCAISIYLCIYIHSYI